ncbi:hypothetical protein ACTA71_011000 [Dictyostelium dimigraforme]
MRRLYQSLNYKVLKFIDNNSKNNNNNNSNIFNNEEEMMNFESVGLNVNSNMGSKEESSSRFYIKNEIIVGNASNQIHPDSRDKMNGYYISEVHAMFVFYFIIVLTILNINL